MVDDHIRYDAVMSTPIDNVKLGINTNGHALSNIEFISPDHNDHMLRNGVIPEVVGQITAYFDNPQFDFSLPLATQGTSFQQSVWQALRNIPYGEAWPYGKVAKYLGSSPRAIGGACRANPIPIVIPCHRVVGSDSLGGFSGQIQGDKINIKQWLLLHEKG